MFNDTMTFSQLSAKLQELGFTAKYFELDNGRKGRVFVRKNKPQANIYLPYYDDHEEVDAFHLRGVVMTLRSHDLAGDANPLSI